MRFAGLALLALFSASVSCADLNERLNDMLAVAEGIINARQDTTAPSSDAPAVPSNTPAPSSAPPDEEPSSSQAPSATPNPTPSNRPSSNNNNNQPSATPTPSRAPSSAPTSDNEPSPTTEIVETTPFTQVTTIRSTVIQTQTAADGSVFETTSVQDIVSSFTGITTNTQAPGLNGNNNDGGSGGLSPQNQKLVGGIVGGVGGALLLGGLALVYLRFRKRNKSKVEIDEYPDGINDYKEGSRRDSVPLNSTPFQSSLEQYHNPPARPNAAANF